MPERKRNEGSDIVLSEYRDIIMLHMMAAPLFPGQCADVFAGGYCKQRSRYMAGYWKNGEWAELPNRYGAFSAEVFSLSVDEGDVFAAGYAMNPGSIIMAGYWKNGEWTELPNPYGEHEAFVLNIIVHDDSILAAGSCLDSARKYRSGYWRNGEWTELNGGSAISRINSTVILDGIVHLGGYYSNGHCRAGYWKNNALSWTALPNMYSPFKSAVVNSMTTIGPGICAGGCSLDSNDVGHAGYWLNGEWTELTNVHGNYYSEVYSMAAKGTDIYAGGASDNSRAASIPGYWKNGIWTELQNGYGPYGAYVTSITVDRSTVFTGGCCSMGGRRMPGFWSNGSWTELPNPYGAYNAAVSSIVVK